MREPLELGVIRNAAKFRANSAAAANADAEYKAIRPRILESGKYRCVFCGHVSKTHSECHHRDGDHANNDESNFAVVDTLCHGYHHLGQRASQERFASEGLGGRTLLAAIPEISAADMNLLQRAIGVALDDKSERPVALELVRHLAQRVAPVTQALGTHMPGDLAGALARLDDEQYARRSEVIGPLRLLFQDVVLENEGRKFKTDHPALPLGTWEAVRDTTPSNAENTPDAGG